MEPLDLFSAITDVDDQDVLEALDVYTGNPKQKRARGIVGIAATLIVVFLGIVAYWYWQGKGKMGKKSQKGLENSMEYITITPSIIEENPIVPVEKIPICTVYQFMLFGGIEYIASIENCDRIGDEIGTARVRNEEKEGNLTLFKDVVVYEFAGLDSSIAVIAYYPEEQEYYVYYSTNY